MIVIPKSAPVRQDQLAFRWLSSSLFLLNLSCWKPLLLSSKRLLPLLSLFLLPSLSRCKALREAKNPPSHTLSVVPQQSIISHNFKNLSPYSLWKIFYIKSPPQHMHHLILYQEPPFSLRIPHHQPRNSSLFNSSLQSWGRQLPLINPSLLTCQESTWIQDGLQSTLKPVEPIEKNSQIFTKYSLKSKESNKKTVCNSELGRWRND